MEAGLKASEETEVLTRGVGVCGTVGLGSVV